MKSQEKVGEIVTSDKLGQIEETQQLLKQKIQKRETNLETAQLVSLMMLLDC